MPDILVVDDEENLSYSIQLTLRRAGYDCRVAETCEEAMKACLKSPPDLALIDVQLPDGNGLDLMGELRDKGIDAPVIVITSFGTVASAVAAMKQGAIDFIQKPLSMEELTIAVQRCLENLQLRNQLDAYRHAQRRQSGQQKLIGECPEMKRVLELADKIASIPAEPGVAGLVTTLILGQTGTGKEVIARYIHHNGPRADRPFIQVNCTAIPENLFEAELFGHEKGTFTDAKEMKKGLMEMADGGTLFLDEIGDMPMNTQAKLLVAIESGRFRRLGGTGEREVDVRVAAATNSDLDRKVQQGEFRADLFYRLKGFCIEMPSLRERGDDLFLLAEYFADRFGKKFHKPAPELSAQTRELMKRYAWPGNIRELGNMIQRAILVNDTEALEPGMLGLDGAGGPAPIGGSGRRYDFNSENCTLVTVEKELLQAALEHTHGNISETARILGLTRGGLRHRLEKLGIT